MLKHIISILSQPIVALPLSILGGSFLMKLVVGRIPSWPDAFKASFELPVDAMFVGVSFAAASVIGPMGDPDSGFVSFGVALFLVPLGVLLWRTCVLWFDKATYIQSAILFLINAAFASAYLIANISIMIGGGK